MANSGGAWLAKFLFDQGLRGDDLKRMWAIGMRESGGRPNIDNAGTNRDGSIDYGLFQINGSAHGARIKEKFGWSMDDLRDPVKNFTVMRWMSNNGKDLSAWGVANPDGSVTGWAKNIGDAQRAKFTAAMESQMRQFDSVAKKAGIDPGAAAGKPGAVTLDSNGVPVADKLNAKDLAAEYDWSYKVIKSNPELWALFKQALNDKTGQWNAKKFQAELRNTDWYKNNAQYARDAWVAEKLGGADWTQQLQDAQSRVQDAMVQMGANLTPDQMKEFSRRYIYEGWGDPARTALMEQALADYINPDAGGLYAGGAGALQEQLTRTAQQNGLPIDNSYIQSAVRSVQGGLTDANYWDQKMRQQAASMWPAWSDQIMAGVDARDLASGYINTMAQTLEIDPYSIDLSDGRLRAAVTRVGQDGKADPMGLWEFQQSLQQSPEWMGTKQAQDKTVDIGVGILQRMGFLG